MDFFTPKSDGSDKEEVQGELLIKKKVPEKAVEIKIASREIEGKPDFKEAAREMITEPPTLGEFKDKEGLEQIKDPSIGPDIRYALTTNNIDLLKRLRWGGLTVGEYREAKKGLTMIRLIPFF